MAVLGMTRTLATRLRRQQVDGDHENHVVSQILSNPILLQPFSSQRAGVESGAPGKHQGQTKVYQGLSVPMPWFIQDLYRIPWETSEWMGGLVRRYRDFLSKNWLDWSRWAMSQRYKDLLVEMIDF